MAKTKILLFYFLAFFQFGCQTYRKIENLKPKSSESYQVETISPKEFDKLIFGDRIIVSAGEREYYMQYGFITDDQLKGSLWRDPISRKALGRKKQYEMIIPINEITELKVYKVNWWLSAGTLVGLLGINYLLLTNMSWGFAVFD